MASQYDLPYTGNQVETLLGKVSDLEDEMPHKTSDLVNDSGFITQANVPTNVSQLTNDSGFITNAPVISEQQRAQGVEQGLAQRMTSVEGKIPSSASSNNKLADQNFVNSSIATNTATYISYNGEPFPSVADLNSYAGPHDNNDYAFVVSTDAAGNTVYSRYKYNGSTWAKEYDLNNSSFTSAQWTAINSLMTAAKTQKLDALPTASELAALFSGKQDVIADLATIRAQAAAAYVKPSGGIPASDIADGVIPDVSGKVNTSDIADNLTTNDATKVLSAKQGKVLNENLTQLGQEVDGGLAPIDITSVLEQGGIASSNGNNSSSTTQIRTSTSGYIVTNSIRVNITSGFVYIYGYNDSGYIGADGWKTGDNTVTIPGATKYRLAFKKSSGNLSPSDFSSLGATVYSYTEGVVIKAISQTFDDGKKKTARANIAAAAETHVEALQAQVGIQLYDYYWSSNSSLYMAGKCCIIPATGISKIYFKGNGSSSSSYAFLTAFDIDNNTFTLVDGTSVTSISASADTSKDVPDGTAFIYVLFAVGATDRKPGYFGLDGGLDITKSIYNSAKHLSESINSFLPLVRTYPYARVRMVYMRALQSDWTANSVYIATLYVITDSVNAKAVAVNQKYTFSENGYLLLNARDLDNISVSKVNSLSGTEYDAVILLKYDSTYGFISGELFPQYISCWRSSVPYIREIPSSPAVLNVYKKAKQFELVKWTPKADVPDNSHAVGFPVGVEVTGLPYSSVKEKSKFVGFDVSLLTFMTAANNPYSLLYTEDTDGSRSRSGYGFAYYGIGSSAYFGIVCNIFALHSLGFDVPWNTGEFHYLADKGILERAYDQSANGLELMDLLWQRGHGSLIDDIYKDIRGNMKQVIWDHSVSPVPTSFTLTPEQFNNRLVQEGLIIYHYKELFKNIHYSPSPFVAVENEPTPEPYEYNNDICTYAGDYACFKPGEKVVLNYNLTDDANFGYTGIKLYKLIDNAYALQGTVIPIDSSHKLDISSYLSGYGKYKATATDGTNESEATFFEVIDNQASYTNVGNGVKRISFSSQNGNPLYLEFVYGGRGSEYIGTHQATDDVAGQCCGTYQFTEEEISQGYAELNPVELRDSQYQATDSTDSVGYRPFNSLAKGDVYVRVHFVGEYGRVISDYILTDLWNAS